MDIQASLIAAEFHGESNFKCSLIPWAQVKESFL